jgi:hypothetical protein
MTFDDGVIARRLQRDSGRFGGGLRGLECPLRNL